MTSYVSPQSEFTGIPIAFSDRYKSSPQFLALFDEGMAMVEQTANYLDGPGRIDGRRLKSPLTIAYATESMRLTTRLMQLASWLLVRRAVNRGEISEDQAASSKHRVVLVPIGRSTKTAGYDELPEGLKDLVEASLKLHDRISRLDRMMLNDEREPSKLPIAHTVTAQFDLLKSAFGAPR
ncbi:MAG: DUF1465 family protein [Chitinophagales bacterium]|nr:DUF1465 family protein [Hyphomicrobiales bacterium]